MKWSHRQGKLIPTKGVVSSDINLLNIRLAFDTNLLKGGTEGASKGFLFLASAADLIKGKPRPPL